MRAPFTITMTKSLSGGFIKPEGKKFNKPLSLGLPNFKSEALCPLCNKKKESASSVHCKKCHAKNSPSVVKEL